MLEIANPDSFLNFIADIQSKQGLIETSHIPVHLENRLVLSKNLHMLLDFADRILMVAFFAITVYRTKNLLKHMKAGTNKQRTLALTSPK